MTNEEKLEAIDKVEREVRKLQKKGYEVLSAIKMSSDYNGGLALEYATRSFNDTIEWMNSEIDTRRTFVHKFGK